MADRPDDQNAFPLRELEAPLHRAQQVFAGHGLWEADPDSPDGGQGPGHHQHFSWRRARDEAWQSFQDAIPGWGLYINWPRYKHVLSALSLSRAQAGSIMVHESGATLEAVLAGLLPSLVDLAKWVGLGALVGGGLGTLGGPFDEVTVPGGAMAGAEIGLWVANSLGLAGLLVSVLKNLSGFVQYAGDATELAWYAGDDPHVPEHADLSAASKLYAFAIAELWMALLEALVAEVMRRLGNKVGDKIAKSEAIGAVAKKVSESKLGSAAGDWFQKNFDNINEAVEKRKAALRKLKEEARGGGVEESPAQISSNAAAAKQTVTGPLRQRLPQDVNVDSTPPAPLPLNRPVGLSAAQNAQVQTDIASARAQGATDFRVNQQQVNAAGDRVGINRPDLQYTDANGQRVYIEYDTPSSARGIDHENRILANDPTGQVILKTIP